MVLHRVYKRQTDILSLPLLLVLYHVKNQSLSLLQKFLLAAPRGLLHCVRINKLERLRQNVPRLRNLFPQLFHSAANILVTCQGCAQDL